MNPLPSEGGIPTASLFVNGYLDLLMLISVASLMVIFGMMLWMARGTGTRRERLFCPVRLRRASVRIGLSPSGKRTDVLRCSIFGRRPITCGKVCLRRANA